MSFRVVECGEQRSDAWRRARAGRLTGSCAEDMLAVVKKGEAADRKNLRRRLVCERFTGIPQEEKAYKGKSVQRGIDSEADAIAAYEGETGRLVQFCGFLAHVDLMAGCSLDGYVGELAPGKVEGILEAKCPNPETHLDYLLGGTVPALYVPQITHNLWITGAAWCDFVSFDDRFDPELSLFVVRVHRDELAIEAYDAAARAFLAEVDRDFRVAQNVKRPAVVLEAALAAAGV